MSQDKDQSQKSQRTKQLLNSYRALLIESDRGSVILATERLSDALEELHKQHITATCEDAENLFEQLFRPYAPLSTINARIQLAYAYGLISKVEFDELEITRRIRNEAAHSTGDFSFNDANISSRVLVLRAAVRFMQSHPEFDQLLGPAERNAVLSPANDHTSLKLHFIVSSMALEVVVVERVLTGLLASRRNS